MFKTILSIPQKTTIILIVLAVIGTISISGSGLIFGSDYSPLFIGGTILGLIILVLWFKNPSIALFSTLFIIFLPDGLLPANIQSNLNRVLTVVVFVVWFFETINKRRRIVLTGTAVLMLGFILWSAATLFWASSVDISLTSIQKYFLRLLLFLFLIPNLIRSPQELRNLMRTLAFSGWLLVFVSIYRVITTGYTAGSRLDVLNENENALGISLLIYLTGVIWLALNDQTGNKSTNKVLSYIYLLLIILITAMSGSRGSAISLGATLFLFLFWKQTRRWGKLGLMVVGLGLMATPIVFSTILDRFAVTTGDTMLGGREALWQATWKLFQTRPWTGVGIGNAPYAIVPFVKYLRSIGGSESAAIHNPILAILAETGIPGLLLYLSVFGSVIWMFIKHYSLNRSQSSQHILIFFSLAVAIFIGYMLSWIKGGGMESDHSYFLMLSLLLIPSQIKTQ